MNGETRRNGWVLALAAVLLTAAAAAIAYNIGWSHGLAENAAAAGAAPPYGWHRHWGFGFGFPFLIILFWLVVLRGLFWGGPWWRARHFGDPSYLPWAFDEWHRRAHERMKEGPSDDPGRRG